MVLLYPAFVLTERANELFQSVDEIPETCIWIGSAFGAVFHNIGQILVAGLIAGWGVVMYLPFLLVSGCLAGTFTGICAQMIVNRSGKAGEYA